MGKHFDDLPLDDTPISAPPEAPEPHDSRDADWYKFLVEIEDLLATGLYTFATDTLEGIQETVERSHRVTPAQRHAVSNIAQSQEKRRRSRRYEGYR